jgi:hypothetical protein
LNFAFRGSLSESQFDPADKSDNLRRLMRRVRVKLSMAIFLAAIVIASVARTAPAQSTDQTLPTPVLTNEISGTIRALDLGDSRSTRHYYAFEATPGDLMITVNSRNLNGDVDVFTAVTYRPLTKITIYANTIPPEVTKGIYFRSNQILILRVEARTPNDDPGVYHITLGGSFKPFSGGIPVAENQESPEANSDRNPNRLSSSGATIERPAEAKAEEPTPEATPETSPSPEKASAPRRTTRRTPPRNRPNRRRNQPAKPAETAKKETPKEEPPPAETKPAVTETSEEKSGEKPLTEKAPQELAGPHLIIEEKDGTRIDHPMSAVRRVVVENTVIVVLLKTGRIERIRMADVSRMAIAPQ